MIWDGEGGNTRDGDCGMSIHFQDCIEILDHSGMYVILCVYVFFGLEQRMFFCCT